LRAASDNAAERKSIFNIINWNDEKRWTERKLKIILLLGLLSTLSGFSTQVCPQISMSLFWIGRKVLFTMCVPGLLLAA